MRMTKAWILAVGFLAALLIGVATVALVGHGGSEITHVPTAQVPSPHIATASAAQVQQVMSGLITRLQQAPSVDANGQPKVVTPAEIETQVRAELAKIGLQP